MTVNQTSEGLINIKSNFDVNITADRLEKILLEHDLFIVARIDHTNNAKNIGESLPDMQLILFGNPKSGTPLMQIATLMAIDLPQKMLIWNDDDNQVWISFNDPAYLMKRHAGDPNAEIVGKLSSALNKFAQLAAQE